ncbi:hypothetical protein PoB_000486100 [Plakobranchus ocellatus]|uniref:Uncharacterized protein n=1 Tax=Plakobranchus ocellatus TaxID=259542 RepID=A0AAV3Y7G5_9GAST|nr:hypothetical protein PoB_000486100 [Plakobranchus ocellatus]
MGSDTLFSLTKAKSCKLLGLDCWINACFYLGPGTEHTLRIKALCFGDRDTGSTGASKTVTVILSSPRYMNEPDMTD